MVKIILLNIDGESHTVDLSLLENKEFNESLITKGVNEFSFTLPYSGIKLLLKFLLQAMNKKSIKN
jgi:hypothetical protein